MYGINISVKSQVVVSDSSQIPIFSYSFNSYIIYDKFWHWWGILPKVNYHFLCFKYVQVKIAFFAPCAELVNLAELDKSSMAVSSEYLTTGVFCSSLTVIGIQSEQSRG